MLPEITVSKTFTQIPKISDIPHRRLDEARVTYQKVLELDSRHSIALGFLGLVYHLMGNLDKAIVKYHEVSLLLSHCQLNLNLVVPPLPAGFER